MPLRPLPRCAAYGFALKSVTKKFKNIIVVRYTKFVIEVMIYLSHVKYVLMKANFLPLNRRKSSFRGVSVCLLKLVSLVFLALH